MIKGSVKFVAAIVAGAFALVSGAQAQSVNFYFVLKNDTSLTPVTSASIGATNGSTLDLSIYAKTTSAFAANTFVTYLEFDRTNNGGSSLLDNKVGLNGTPSQAVVAGSSWSTVLFNDFTTRTTSTPNGYGVELDASTVASGGLQLSGGVKLADISLSNKGLASGQSYTVSLVNNGTSETENNFVTDGTTKLVSGTSNLSISAVPEPATMAVLGLGLLPILRRRRSAK